MLRIIWINLINQYYPDHPSIRVILFKQTLSYYPDHPSIRVILFKQTISYYPDHPSIRAILFKQTMSESGLTFTWRSITQRLTTWCFITRRFLRKNIPTICIRTITGYHAIETDAPFT